MSPKTSPSTTDRVLVHISILWLERKLTQCEQYVRCVSISCEHCGDDHFVTVDVLISFVVTPLASCRSGGDENINDQTSTEQRVTFLSWQWWKELWSVQHDSIARDLSFAQFQKILASWWKVCQTWQIRKCEHADGHTTSYHFHLSWSGMAQSHRLGRFAATPHMSQRRTRAHSRHRAWGCAATTTSDSSPGCSASTQIRTISD